MSTTFYLTLFPPEELMRFKSEQDMSSLGFEIDFNQFAHDLKLMWSDVSLTVETDSVEWELEDDDGIITGTVENAFIVTVMPGSSNRIVEFVNWYRSFIPKQYMVYMFHLGESKGLAIEENFLLFVQYQSRASALSPCHNRGSRLLNSRWQRSVPTHALSG
jgi:hypothetical protein